MLRVHLIFYGIFLLFVSRGEAGWEDLAQQKFNNGCYIQVDEYLTLEKIKNPYELRIDQAKKNLARFVKEKLLDPALAFPDRVYFEGWRAWKEGNLSQARNCWIKYREYKKREENPTFPFQIREVQDYLELTEERSVRRPVSVVLIQPAVSPPEITLPARSIQPVRRKNKRADPNHVESKKKSREIPVYLLKKAELATSNGQIEYAERLYRIALQFDPDSPLVQERLATLKKLME